MEMKVGHCLASVVAMIDDEPVSGASDAKFFPETGRDDEEMTEELLVSWLDVRYAGDWLDRHDEQMHGRLRLNIPEGEAILITVDDIGRDFARDDPAKERRLRCHASARRRARHQ